MVDTIISQSPQQLLSQPYVWLLGLVLLITVIARWKIYNKTGLHGIEAIIPVWNNVVLTLTMWNGFMAFMLTVLYIISIALVVFAYIQTKQSMLTYATILGYVIWLVESTAWAKAAKGFNKNIFYKILMFVPGISYILQWDLGFNRNNAYLRNVDELKKMGVNIQEVFAMSGIYAQDQYEQPKYIPRDYVEVPPTTGFIDEPGKVIKQETRKLNAEWKGYEQNKNQVIQTKPEPETQQMNQDSVYNNSIFNQQNNIDNRTMLNDQYYSAKDYYQHNQGYVNNQEQITETNESIGTNKTVVEPVQPVQEPEIIEPDVKKVVDNAEQIANEIFGNQIEQSSTKYATHSIDLTDEEYQEYLEFKKFKEMQKAEQTKHKNGNHKRLSPEPVLTSDTLNKEKVFSGSIYNTNQQIDTHDSLKLEADRVVQEALGTKKSKMDFVSESDLMFEQKESVPKTRYESSLDFLKDFHTDVTPDLETVSKPASKANKDLFKSWDDIDFPTFDDITTDFLQTSRLDK